ncbi:MAG: hypothetical protein HC888_02230 [Candidatus Competibacteraceae bacterium]|nr:hypothetical protein [Candidatus Competibacteraceae bacterium]
MQPEEKELIRQALISYYNRRVALEKITVPPGKSAEEFAAHVLPCIEEFKKRHPAVATEELITAVQQPIGPIVILSNINAHAPPLYYRDM